MKDLDDQFDIEKYNLVFQNSSEKDKDEDLLASIPGTSNRSYKNESEDDFYPQNRHLIPRPGTFQGVAENQQESFNLLKSGESYDNFKQRGTAGFGEEEQQPRNTSSFSPNQKEETKIDFANIVR